MTATGKTAEAVKKKDKATFDAKGLEEAKARLGGRTQIYRATIEVMSPGLLQNSATGLLDTLDKKAKKSAKEDKFEWRDAAYLVDGLVVHPAWHLRSAMVAAAKQFQIPGKGKKTYNAATRATLFIEPELIPLRLAGEKVSKPTMIDERITKTAQGSPKPGRRPLFKAGHTLSFLIYVNWNHIPAEVVRDVLIEAGRFQGIGDYRPEFGRFEVTEFVLVDDQESELESILS